MTESFGIKRMLSRDEERGIVLSYELGLSLRHIEVEYDITRHTIYRVLKKHKVETNRKAK